MSAEENKALVRRWFEELDKRNFAIIDELLPVDYVDHNPPLPDLPPGREGVRQSSLTLYAAFPDAVHHPHFPNIMITPDKPYSHWCEFEIK